ncbi:hypothetical protein BHE74_00054097 [Ensete ventricosum]|nr:hypothetical protein BHE74_00054097 [Ensete ventricosum]
MSATYSSASWRGVNLLLLLCAIWSTTGLLLVQAKVHYHKWDISYKFKSPDCYKKLAVTINGQTPGPTINAQQGDTIVVRVKNSLLTENVAIHWHGIRQVLTPLCSWSGNHCFCSNMVWWWKLCFFFFDLQIGTPWFDGTEGVTQCPIVAGDTFDYRFVVDRVSYFYTHKDWVRLRKKIRTQTDSFSLRN